MREAIYDGDSWFVDPLVKPPNKIFMTNVPNILGHFTPVPGDEVEYICSDRRSFVLQQYVRSSVYNL